MGDGGRAGGGGALAAGSDGKGANGGAPRRFVLLKTDTGYRPRPVETGMTNFDYAEVLGGLQEGDNIAIVSSSRAAADREQFMNRIRNMSGFSGFGGQQQQRPAGR